MLIAVMTVVLRQVIITIVVITLLLIIMITLIMILIAIIIAFGPAAAQLGRGSPRPWWRASRPRRRPQGPVYIILYHIILYHIILYHSILYHISRRRSRLAPRSARRSATGRRTSACSSSLRPGDGSGLFFFVRTSRSERIDPNARGPQEDRRKNRHGQLMPMWP